MANVFKSMMPGGGENAAAAAGGGGGGGGGDAQPWWLKYAGKVAGVGAGIGAIIFGFMAFLPFTTDPLCIVAGIWQILAGCIVILIEAPFMCMFLDFVQSFSRMVDGRPVWQKAALYLVLSLPAFLLCRSVSTFIGSALIFATSVIYGVQVLGKKAPREQMMAAAAASGQQPATTPATTDMKSDLVGNIQGQDVEAAKTAAY